MKLISTLWQKMTQSLGLLGQLLLDLFRKHLVHAAILAALLLLPSYRFYDLEENIYDSQLKVKHLLGNWVRPSVPPDIAIIGIDDQARRADSSGRLNKMPPISRSYLADLLRAIQGWKPKAIVLDVFLDHPAEQAADDLALEKSIRGVRDKGIPVVFACRLGTTGGMRAPLLPVHPYLDTANPLVGNAHVMASSVDGVIRRAAVATPVLKEAELVTILQAGMEDQLRFYQLDASRPGDGAYYFWTLAGVALLSSEEEAQRAQLLRMLKSAPFLIDFSTHPSHVYASYSSAQVLSGNLDGSLVSGRIVLIGVNGSESPDRHPTPLSARSLSVEQYWSLEPVYEQQFSGTEIQAYIIHTLESQLRATGGIREASTFPLLALGLGLGIAVLTTLNRLTLGAWAALVICIPVVYVVVATLLFQVSAVYLPILRPIAAYLLATGIGFGILTARLNHASEGELK